MSVISAEHARKQLKWIGRKPVPRSHCFVCFCDLLQLEFFWFLVTFECGAIQSEEEKLLDYLFVNYNPSARPVLNSSKTVFVRLAFSLLQIQDLVSVAQFRYLCFVKHEKCENSALRKYKCFF